MPALAIRNVFRLLIALAVLLNAWPSLRAAPSVHDLGRLSAVETSEGSTFAGLSGHTHSHDEEPDGGAPPVHGHEHKDHSHVTFGLPVFPPALIGPEHNRLHQRERCRASDNLPFRVDRPPCAVSTA